MNGLPKEQRKEFVAQMQNVHIETVRSSVDNGITLETINGFENAYFPMIALAGSKEQTEVHDSVKGLAAMNKNCRYEIWDKAAHNIPPVFSKRFNELIIRIFIIEDDPTIAQTLKKHLEGWDYKVECAKDFHNITAEFAAFDPQLVLLDIKLPFYDGYYWCGEIRKLSKVPVIFLSSASDNMNVVMAMNMGGDDFIAKPFDLSVLTAKINAVLRRAYSFSGNSDLISHGSVILDISSAVVTNGDKKAELTKNELLILRTLMENAGRIISRDTLMQRLWETDCFVDENTLTVNVSRLRKKLENIGLENYIATKVGMGYMVV